jgi:hypothetical protein
MVKFWRALQRLLGMTAVRPKSCNQKGRSRRCRRRKPVAMLSKRAVASKIWRHRAIAHTRRILQQPPRALISHFKRYLKHTRAVNGDLLAPATSVTALVSGPILNGPVASSLSSTRPEFDLLLLPARQQGHLGAGLA